MKRILLPAMVISATFAVTTIGNSATVAPAAPVASPTHAIEAPPADGTGGCCWVYWAGVWWCIPCS